MNRGSSLFDPTFEIACLGRFAVDNKTNSFRLNVSLFFLPFLSAFSFCLSTESAIASLTYRRTAWRWSRKSLTDFFVSDGAFSIGSRGEKLASMEFAVTLTAFVAASDLGSVASPPLRVELAPKSEEGTVG